MSYDDALSAHTQMQDIHQSLRIPFKTNGDQEALVKKLSRVACLHATVSLSDMGYAAAVKKEDSYSQGYYEKFRSNLQPKVLESELELLRFARKLKQEGKWF